MRELRQYGWRERYVSAIPGINSRLDEIQAAVLRIRLPHLCACNERRRVIAAKYQTALSATGLELPFCRKNAEHVYHQFVIRFSRRDQLQVALKEHGITTLVHYQKAVHRQEAYCRRISHGDLTYSEQAAGSVLSLPMYPELTDKQINWVTKILRLLVVSNHEAKL